MVKELFSRIIDSMEKKILVEDLSIDENIFVDLKTNENGRIGYVDGGQAELLKANNFSLQFIRVCGVIFEGKVKKSSIIEEFFVLISMNGDEYETEVFLVKGKGISSMKINSFDETIREGTERSGISKVGGIVRRFAELELAARLTAETDTVVLDGNLKAIVKGEKEKLNELFSQGEKNNCVVAGLAKTSKMIKDGKCAISRLNKREGSWHYKLREGKVGESQQDYSKAVIVYAVRLNDNSKYVFEFNININQKENMIDVLGMLKYQSNDVVFPGYPYGLLQVDRFARVSNEEKDYLLTIFKAQAGKKWSKIEKSLNVLNAHDILDNV